MKCTPQFTLLTAAFLSTATAKDEKCNGSKDCTAKCIDGDFHIISISDQYLNPVYSFGCTTGPSDENNANGYTVAYCAVPNGATSADRTRRIEVDTKACAAASGVKCTGRECALANQKNLDAFEKGCKDGGFGLTIRSKTDSKDIKDYC